jgi:uncharacterized membrane protein (DUF4010 family)
LWIPPSVRAFIRELANEELRRAINLAIMGLMGDPVPPEAREFRVDDDLVKYAYELDVYESVTIFYTVDGEHVFVQSIAWRLL